MPKKRVQPKEKMLVLIAGYLETHRASPTVREIAALYGCSAPFALRCIRLLESDKMLFRDAGAIVAVRKAK